MDSREFKLWYRNNHSKIFSWFVSILDYEVDCLIKERFIFSHVEDGITYYDLTTKGHDNLKAYKPSNWISLVTAFVSILPILNQVLLS